MHKSPLTSFRLAKILQNLGFPQGKGTYYTLEGKIGLKGMTYAPTLDEARNWFREVHQLHIFVLYRQGQWKYSVFNMKENSYEIIKKNVVLHNDYNEALNFGIFYALRFCKFRDIKSSLI